MTELNEKQKREIKELAAKFDLRFVVLFGSQADGRPTDQSDYDMAIMTQKSQPLYDNFDRLTQILFRLSAILQMPEEKLDLTDLCNEDILLRCQIVLNGKLLAGNENDYENFRAFVIREYQGAEALRELEIAIINRRQKLLATSLARLPT